MNIIEKIRNWNRDVEIGRTIKDARRRLKATAEELRSYTPKRRAELLAKMDFYKRLDVLRKELEKFDAAWKNHYTTEYKG